MKSAISLCHFKASSYGHYKKEASGALAAFAPSPLTYASLRCRAASTTVLLCFFMAVVALEKAIIRWQPEPV